MTASCHDSSSIAVFLGPSLSRGAARRILDADYLPPAQFGDVYALLGRGVDTIVLIDGLFHGAAPVWQRELYRAVQNGLRVYGAGSMGALRAAELHTLGMIGAGRIFEAYRDGDIDGDDEVALLHAEPEEDYRPLSEPLVNIRFNLRAAVGHHILDAAHADALIAAMKALPFWQRSLDALWRTPAFRALDEGRQAGLRRFYADHAIDWKERDAAAVLQQVAQAGEHPAPEPTTTAEPIPASGVGHHDTWRTRNHYDRFRLLKRRFARDPHRSVTGQQIMDRLLSDRQRRRYLQWWCGARFFVREWARERGIAVPPAEWRATALRHATPWESRATWLRENGLTLAEYRELFDRQVLWSWLLSQEPERFDVSPALQDEELLSVLPPSLNLRPGLSICPRAELARALPYVVSFCRMLGASPEPAIERALANHWRDTLARLSAEQPGGAHAASLVQAIWALSRGPHHLGFATWSLSTEALGLLQITGAMAHLSASWEPEGIAS